MNKKNILSVGNNRKLGKHVGVLSITEGVTCPGATDVCKKVCYGKKASRIYKAVAAKRKENYELTKAPGFAAALVEEIERRKLKMIRLHEAGDVYSQAYLNELYNVCESLPDVKFLMYTKSFHLDWSNKPANLALYWSVDSSSTSAPATGPRATLVLKSELPPANSVTCSPGSPRNYCGASCQVCWNGKLDVYFPKH